MSCELWDAPDIELYFYGELDEMAQARVAAHLRTCAACRRRLEDLRAIRRALASQPVVDAPPAGDWSGFMRRLDTAVASAAAMPASRPAVLERSGRSWQVRHLVAFAAMLAIVSIGVFMAARLRQPKPVAVVEVTPPGDVARPVNVDSARTGLTPTAALRDITADHLERSKLVVLGLAARDPQHTQPADWQYERQLAGALLSDTRLYRLAAQERGVTDVAHVMRDLETVLLEASMTDNPDRESLERVQRLIARRGLVTKMQMVAAGL